MKRKLLTLFTTFILTGASFPVMAQENSSSEVETSIVEESNLIENHGEEYANHTKDYILLVTDVLQTSSESATESTEVDNQLILEYVDKLVKKEIVVEEAAALKARINELNDQKVNVKELIASLDETMKEKLSEATLRYLEDMKNLFLSEDGEVYHLATNNQIEVTWQLVKIAKAYGFIQEDSIQKFDSLELDLGTAEFHRLVGYCYNEDGSFKDTLYSKHMVELYNLLKDKKADFIKEYQERYDNILKEIEARKNASDAVKQIEEKRANGETVTEEELKAVEVAVSKVQTQSHREVAKSTKEAVVTSQVNNTTYEKPAHQPVEKPQTTQPTTSQPVEVPVAPQPEPTPPVIEESPQPDISTTTLAPGAMEYAGHFATRGEADAYAISNIDWNRHGSYFVSGSPETGYDVYFITAY